MTKTPPLLTDDPSLQHPFLPFFLSQNSFIKNSAELRYHQRRLIAHQPLPFVFLSAFIDLRVSFDLNAGEGKKNKNYKYPVGFEESSKPSQISSDSSEILACRQRGYPWDL